VSRARQAPSAQGAGILRIDVCAAARGSDLNIPPRLAQIHRHLT
jgi:hypothetical protein